MSWQLQDAKQRFSELVRRTLSDGPQTITRHGEAVVVVVPAADFHAEAPEDFAAFLLDGPDLSDLELGRSGRPARDVELHG